MGASLSGWLGRGSLSSRGCSSLPVSPSATFLAEVSWRSLSRIRGNSRPKMSPRTISVLKRRQNSAKIVVVLPSDERRMPLSPPSRLSLRRPGRQRCSPTSQRQALKIPPPVSQRAGGFFEARTTWLALKLCGWSPNGLSYAYSRTSSHQEPVPGGRMSILRIFPPPLGNGPINGNSVRNTVEEVGVLRIFIIQAPGVI